MSFGISDFGNIVDSRIPLKLVLGACKLLALFKLKVMASLCSHYFIGYAGLPRGRTTEISGLWASICTIFFLNNISS